MTLNPNRAELLADVRRKHRAATAKISRMKRNGADISGTPADPRRILQNVKGYTTRQLESYDEVLTAFNRRETGFVGGAEGRPIAREKWNRYKRLERQVNRMFAGKLAAIADVNVPSSGMTISQRQAMMESKFPTMHGRAANNPYSIVERRPSQIQSERALEKFTRQMEQRIADNYDYSTNRKARANVRDMLKEAGLSSLQKRVDRLSAHQFRLMWAFTKFADSLSLRYENMKATAVQGMGRAREQQIENAAAAIEHHLDEAEGFPRTAPAQSENAQNVYGGLRNNRRRSRKR